MPDQMQLIITLRRDVPDRDTAHSIYLLVIERLADHPDVTVTGHVSNHFALPEVPPP